MCSSISKAANELQGHQNRNTTISHTFLTTKSSSWQLHLQRIALYLQQGPGVWWHKTDDGYEFHDGSSCHDHREEGPQLTHFQDTGIEEIHHTKERAWSDICSNRTELPTMSVCMYDDDGEFVERLTFGDANSIQPEQKTEVPSNDDSKDEDKCDEAEQELTAPTPTPDYTEVCLQEETTTETQSEAEEVAPVYKTKYATAVFKALGESPLLSELDQLRHSIRESQDKVPQTTRAAYKKLMHSVQARIKIKVAETKADIKHYEQ